MARQTASQTIGPYFAYCLTPEPWGKQGITSNQMISADTPGEHILIQGRVLDGAGAPVGDASGEADFFRLDPKSIAAGQLLRSFAGEA